MAGLEEIPARRIPRILEAAVDAAARVTITVRTDSRWLTYSSAAIGLRDDDLLLEVPRVDREAEQAFQPGIEVGLSFRLGRDKYVFSAPLVEAKVYSPEAGVWSVVVVASPPEMVHRIERRRCDRTDIALERVVRATFWLGGEQVESTGAIPDQPTWAGSVENVSDGGICLRTALASADCVEIGDILGIRLTFTDDETFCADVRYRHARVDGDAVHMGLEFTRGAVRRHGDPGGWILAKIAECLHELQEAPL